MNCPLPVTEPSRHWGRVLVCVGSGLAMVGGAIFSFLHYWNIIFERLSNHCKNYFTSNITLFTVMVGLLVCIDSVLLKSLNFSSGLCFALSLGCRSFFPCFISPRSISLSSVNLSSLFSLSFWILKQNLGSIIMPIVYYYANQMCWIFDNPDMNNTSAYYLSL